MTKPKTPEQIAEEIISKVEKELQEESKEIQSSNVSSKASSTRDSAPKEEMPEEKGTPDTGSGDAKAKRTSNTGSYKSKGESHNTSDKEVGLDVVGDGTTKHSQTDENASLSDQENDGTGLAESIHNILTSSEMKAGIQEHINALFGNDGTLTEEFTQKASTIFEAAVMERSLAVAKIIQEENEKVVASYIDELKEEAESYKAQVVESIDSYLTHVAEEWLKENEIQVETGLREEIATDFISGLKNLFVEHYIDIPDEKYDVLGEMNDKIEALTEQYNESLKVQSLLTEELRKEKKARIINEATSDLTLSEKDRLTTMLEGVSVSNETELQEKIGILKESYFQPTPNTDNVEKVSVLTEESKSFANSDPSVLALASRLRSYAPIKDKIN